MSGTQVLRNCIVNRIAGTLEETLGESPGCQVDDRMGVLLNLIFMSDITSSCADKIGRRHAADKISDDHKEFSCTHTILDYQIGDFACGTFIQAMYHVFSRFTVDNLKHYPLFEIYKATMGSTTASVLQCTFFSSRFTF